MTLAIEMNLGAELTISWTCRSWTCGASLQNKTGLFVFTNFMSFFSALKKLLIEITKFFKVSGCNQFILATCKYILFKKKL